MADFSQTHPLTGFFAPMRFEADVTDCVVVGQVPPELDAGALLPDPRRLDLSAEGCG